MAFFENSVTSLAEATIKITPPGGFLGTDFRLRGTATIRMSTTTFIRVGGEGTTSQFDTFVTTGFRIKIRVGDSSERDAIIVVDGTQLRWSLEVTGATAGPLPIEATLVGTVRESESRTVNGETEHRSETVQVTRRAAVDVTIDPTPPELKVQLSPSIPQPSLMTLPLGPPYRAHFEGTVEDNKGIKFVGVHFGGAVRPAEQLAANWASWRGVVTLPNRDEEHTIVITAEDNAGNTASHEETVPKDSSPPSIALHKPPTNPFLVLFEEGGITIPIELLVVSNHTLIRAVRWRLNGGPENVANNAGFLWEFQVRIESPGAHSVQVTAIDEGDKVSEPFDFEIRAQIEG